MTRDTTDAAAAGITQQAAACMDVAALATAARCCVACSELAVTRQQVVVGDAPPGARLLVVGEAPGAREDELGRPFVGKAGSLLDLLLDEAGLSRDRVAVANVLKCRPPGNRAPRRAEVGRCRGWLDRQVELVDPPVVLALGGTALGWSLGPGILLRDARLRVHDWRGRKLLVSYHPSAAIRFGPAGMPMAALREDVGRAVELACAS